MGAILFMVLAAGFESVQGMATTFFIVFAPGTHAFFITMFLIYSGQLRTVFCTKGPKRKPTTSVFSSSQDFLWLR